MTAISLLPIVTNRSFRANQIHTDLTFPRLIADLNGAARVDSVTLPARR